MGRVDVMRISQLDGSGPTVARFTNAAVIVVAVVAKVRRGLSCMGNGQRNNDGCQECGKYTSA